MDRLSPKNKAFLAHVADGWTNAQIAKEYQTTTSVVAGDLSRIMTFLHAVNRAHAVGIALRGKIIR